ncbi:MAG: AAA family ATPase, partial [Anaerovoracaceae bacterium]
MLKIHWSCQQKTPQQLDRPSYLTFLCFQDFWGIIKGRKCDERRNYERRKEPESMGGEERKIISIGMEDFKTIIEKNGYFVDKTRMIQQLLDSNSMVTLFTRPRRFGKTLNL